MMNPFSLYLNAIIRIETIKLLIDTNYWAIPLLKLENSLHIDKNYNIIFSVYQLYTYNGIYISSSIS